jgi:hypothetical protein
MTNPIDQQISKAAATADMLVQDLRDLAAMSNESPDRALAVLSLQLLDLGQKIVTTLSELEK